MIKIAVIAFIIITIIAIAQKIKENQPLGIILNSRLLPEDVFFKFQGYMNSLPKVQNVQVVSWNESTKILEYDNGKKIITLKLREDGFHRVRGVDD